MALTSILVKMSFYLYIALTILNAHSSGFAAVDQAGSIGEEGIGSLSTAVKAKLRKIFENESICLAVN